MRPPRSPFMCLCLLQNGVCLSIPLAKLVCQTLAPGRDSAPWGKLHRANATFSSRLAPAGSKSSRGASASLPSLADLGTAQSLGARGRAPAQCLSPSPRAAGPSPPERVAPVLLCLWLCPCALLSALDPVCDGQKKEGRRGGEKSHRESVAHVVSVLI